MENLLLKMDSFKIKARNENSVPEALVKKGEDEFYIEMKKLKTVPHSIYNSVGELFKKSRNKFKSSKGILFVGTFDFFKYPGGKQMASPEFKLFKRLISLRFERGFGSSIIAIILVNFVIKTDLNKIILGKEYYIINKPQEKGGKSLKFFEDIFEVDSFVYL